MEIILSKQCLSLVGMLERGLGYYIRSTKTGRFFGQRSKHSVPPDGHWQFIVLCAEMARNGLYISDIRVSGYELKIALDEAAFIASALQVDLDYEYNAEEVLAFKERVGI